MKGGHTKQKKIEGKEEIKCREDKKSYVIFVIYVQLTQPLIIGTIHYTYRQLDTT